METVAKDIKQHSKKVDNIQELKAIAVKYATVKNYVFSRYSGINSLEILSTYRKDIRDAWVETKFAFQWGLPARYWKNALDEAISNINSGWSNTFLRVKMATKRNPNLTADEKDFIYYVLKAIPILHSILTNRAFDKPERLLNLIIREKYIYNLVGRYVRKYKGTISFSKKKRSFFIDAPMYKYKTVKGNNIIEITGLEKLHRIDIILKDKNVHSGGLRVVITDDNSVIIHKVKQINTTQDIDAANIIGIDKGYATLFAVNSGKFYGEKLNQFLNIETERLNSVNAGRNKIWALMKKYVDDSNIGKADKIREHNYGKVKYNNQKHRFDSTVKSFINH